MYYISTAILIKSFEGYITAKDILPVTKLNFGRTQVSGKHTLGRLECSGRVSLSGKPTSCKDLFLMGHTLNGFYQVKGIGANSNKIETVYCNYDQQPSQSPGIRRL